MYLPFTLQDLLDFADVPPPATAALPDIFPMSGSTGSPYRALVGRGSHHADFQGVARARARRPAKEALITPRRRGARPAIRERAPLIRLACVTPQQPTQHGGTRLLPHVARQARGSFRRRSLTHISAPRSRYTAECGVSNGASSSVQSWSSRLEHNVCGEGSTQKEGPPPPGLSSLNLARPSTSLSPLSVFLRRRAGFAPALVRLPTP